MFLLAISIPTILGRFHTANELGLIALLLAIYFAIVTIKEKWQVHRTKSWPTTQGAIENLRIEKISGGLNGIDYWKVRFHYKYRVQEEHGGDYAFNCKDEEMGQGAVTGLQDKTVCVHYKPSDEGKSVLWEDEIWDLWWDTYWQMTHQDDTPEQSPASAPNTLP